MTACMAQATRYVGKGPERKAYSGPCVLDIGHDLDHLPAQLAMEQQYDAAFNAGVEAAWTATADWLNKADEDKPSLAETIETVRRG